MFLTQVNIGLGEEDRSAADRGTGPKLFGQIPRRYMEHGYSIDVNTREVETSGQAPDFVVDELREPIPFTGGLLLGNDLIDEMYIHRGFQPAYTYRKVYELVFDCGKLTEEHDRSTQMAEYRQMESDHSLRPDDYESPTELEAWFKHCFSLEYEEF